MGRKPKEKKPKAKWVPPFARTAKALRERVMSLAPGAFFGTEVAFAVEYGLSRMTARKAVSELVSEGLVERRAGVGLFVRDNGTATRRFRFLAGNLSWDFAISIASAARLEAMKSGAALDLFDAFGDEDRLCDELLALPKGGSDGAIILSMHGAKFLAALKQLREAKYPFVLVDQAVPDVPCVVSDSVSGGILAAKALIDAGRTRLAFIGDFEADTVVARWDGFQKTVSAFLKVSPMKYDLGGVSRLADWAENVQSVVKGIVESKEVPNGIFCSCDAVTRNAMRVLVQSGLRVPEDVSIIGFDDDPIAEWTSPALTTIRQDLVGIGSAAAQALCRRIADPSYSETIDVPVQFVMRGSV